MKGIILAGGSGTRLYPLTLSVSKQLMPVYDKPMIYYPLSVLMLAGIREILIISTPNDQAAFKALLGDGSQWGIELSYTVQSSPDGLAQAFILGESFIGNDTVSLVLGDNIFFGQGLVESLQRVAKNESGATIFSYYVKNPERYGVVTFDKDYKVIDLEEKPENPKSNFAVTGLYFYDNNVIGFAKSIKPSHRGELEITDLNKIYMKQGELAVEVLGRGFAWLDTGTHESLLAASNFIHVVEERQNLKIACPEEIAYRMKYINEEQLQALAFTYNKNEYGKYLLGVLKHGCPN
jgi:glucose-1-phosphate thymidylyltransferase